MAINMPSRDDISVVALADVTRRGATSSADEGGFFR
jgi:hypothetical protein